MWAIGMQFMIRSTFIGMVFVMVGEVSTMGPYVKDLVPKLWCYWMVVQ